MAFTSEQHHHLLHKENSFLDDDNESGTSLAEPGLEYSKPQTRRTIWKLLLFQIPVLLLYTTLVFTAVIFLYPFIYKNPFSPFDLKYNAIHDAYQYKVREVGYNFDEINAFKGPPVEEVDKQWDLLLNGVHTVRLSRTELEQMNMSSIQLADGSEDYIAVPIAYHMLHCLYNIYRYAHPDFFGEDPNGPEWIVTHTDHCIDNLRQFVQCHGGNGFETYRWLDNRKLPWPVVSTDEVCIDWPHFDGWVRDHGVSSHDMHKQQLLVHPKFGSIYDADLSVHSHET
ncbi:hypothetical protein V490_01386 [Pseudogymnoascus sp. VKM F-3557]|nr:hypothetical protein V490_01386 [Pseudogymnoascus sp. VKM F-3557]